MEKNNNVSRRSVSPLSNRFYDFGFFPSKISDFPVTSDKIADPSINVKETDTIHQIQVSAPGYKKENFKIDIDENVLTISNEFKEEKTNENEKWYRKEFRRSSLGITEEDLEKDPSWIKAKVREMRIETILEN